MPERKLTISVKEPIEELVHEETSMLLDRQGESFRTITQKKDSNTHETSFKNESFRYGPKDGE